MAESSFDVVSSVDMQEVKNAIAQAMQDEFGHGRYQAGALAGIAAVSRELRRHLPAADGNPNELSDDVTLL